MNNKNINKDNNEKQYVLNFLKTTQGKDWVKRNSIDINSMIKTEGPDFVFENLDGSKIGLEVTKLIVPCENTFATQTLISIGNQVRAFIKKKYNIDISVIIDKYDKRIWSGKKSDFLDAAYHPGFKKILSIKQFKDSFIKAMERNVHLFKPGNIIQESIDVNGDLFKITAEAWINPFVGQYDTHVNNVQLCIENPITELQDEINKKNRKYASYKEKCKQCTLLIIIPDCREGFSCSFNRLLLKMHHFKSKFKYTILFDSKSQEVIYI